jgi:hypothetical protein
MGVASRQGRLLLLLTLLLAGGTVWADAPADAALRLLQQRANNSAIALSERMMVCDRVREANAIPSIDAARIEGVDANTLRAALAYLSRRNYVACEGALRPQLAYGLGAMTAVATEYGVTAPELEALPEVNAELLYPSSRDIEWELAYERLPEAAREYLDGVVGTEPFDLVEALASVRAAEQK